MRSCRASLGLCWLPDGRIFAVGGLAVDGHATASVEMLQCSWSVEESAKSGWKYVAPMLEKRSKHGVAYIGGKLIAAGGEKKNEDLQILDFKEALQSVECYSLPSSQHPKGQWTQIRSLTRAMKMNGLLLLGDDLFAIGKGFCLFYKEASFYCFN